MPHQKKKLFTSFVSAAIFLENYLCVSSSDCIVMFVFDVDN